MYLKESPIKCIDFILKYDNIYQTEYTDYSTAKLTVCDCGICWSYSLNIFNVLTIVPPNLCIKMFSYNQINIPNTTKRMYWQFM